MNGRRTDASTSTDDLKDRPLCLFYFTHPFGVLSPEPPTVTAAPAHVARAFLNMEPVSPLHFFSSDSYAPESSPSTAHLNFDLGNAKVHKNPVNLVSVAKTRKCTIELGGRREALSSSLISSDFWFSSGSSSRSYEYARRLIPYNRILPPLRLPAPHDAATDSSDDLWPLKCVNPARFSLPPIKMPKSKTSKASRMRVEEVSRLDSSSGAGGAGGGGGMRPRPERARRVLGVRKPRPPRPRLSGARRLLTRLMQRAVKGRFEGSSSSPALREALAVLRDAWPEPRPLRARPAPLAFTQMSYTRKLAAVADTHEREHEREQAGVSAREHVAQLPPRPGASPGLLRRRYSVPETIMRKYRLAQQRSETEESGQVTSRGGASASASASPARGCGSCGAGAGEARGGARRERELMRRSALLRRLWGRACAPGAACCCADCDAHEPRSLDTSRSELRPLSGSFASSRHSHAAGWASPKRQRLDFCGSEEMLRAAMRNSYDRAEESRCERAAAERAECADSACHYRHETSSYIETTDALNDSDSNFYVGSDRNASTQYSERLSSDAATVEVKSDVVTDTVESENSGSNAHLDDHSFTDTSDTFSTSMSTAKETNGFKFAKQISKSAHIDGRISERSGSVDNDDTNVLPYDTPLAVETPSYELLEIVVSETLNNPTPAIKSNVPENTSTQTLKAPPPHRLPPNMNIDEYVSNILVESLNSLTDQLECMNASIGSDRKINIVEKEIKVKLQNTGVNTIVHLSPTSNNQIIFGNEELCNSDERKDGCNNVRDVRDSVAIREELVSVESNNNQSPGARDRSDRGDCGDHSDHSDHSATTAPYYEPFNSLHHDSVNHAVLQQIQKLFQDELQNMDSDINFQVGSIPGVSHIEISNVDVFLDNNAESILGNNDTIEVHTQNGVEISEIISGVGTGNYFEDVENNVVVPRFSAFPNTDSMEVNTSSSDDAEIIGSDCTSLVDSLDDPNSPRSILLRRSFNNNGYKRSELVRSAIDVLDLLPENSSRDDSGHPKEKGEAFFIRIKDDDCDCEKENVVVADHMPEKIKQRLFRRHRKREMRMECARRSKVKQLKRELERQRHAHLRLTRRDLERECAALLDALLDEVIAKIAHDEHKCMRIKQKPPRMVMSKSDENVSKKTWRKDVDFHHSKESLSTSKNGSSSYSEKPSKGKKSDRHHIHGKLSLLTHPTSPSSDDRGPKRIYQKSEIHEGNKCIEILEILEYVNGSQSSPETTTSDENHNHKSKKSRIPVPVYERIPKTPKGYSHKIHYSSTERLNSPSVPRERSRKPTSSLASMLMEVLADDESAEEPAVGARGGGGGSPPARRASVPHCEPRSRSNSLRFRRVFDSIPEERSSLSIDSNEEVNHNRRASAPTLVESVNTRQVPARKADDTQTQPVRSDESVKSFVNSRISKETKSAGTSPLFDVEQEKRAQRLKSQTTMTSPSRKSASTSPMHGTSAAPSATATASAAASAAATGGGPAPTASGKRGLASRSRAWLGFTRPDSSKLEEGSKEVNVEVGSQEERAGGGRRTVRTIQTETAEPVIVGGDRDAKPRARDPPRKTDVKSRRWPDRTKSESRVRRAAEDAGRSPPGRMRDSDYAVRTTDKRKIRTISVERSEEETVRTKSVKLPEFRGSSGGAGGAGGSSDSSDSGGSLLCSLAPKWLSAHARHRRGARRAAASPPPPATDTTSTGDHHSPGGWSVTVAGSCRAALPADLEMRLRFPHERSSPAPPAHTAPQFAARALRDSDKRQQECSCGACARAACVCTCACAPLPPAHAPHHAPHAPHATHEAGKLKLTMKKEALDSSILASKSVKKSSDPLPDLETFRASRSKTKSSVKTRRGYSLHCWLPEDEPAPLRTSNGLSVLGCAIIPELKPRVPTMSERDLTRAYTPRHYLRS